MIARKGSGLGASMAGGNPTRGRAINDFYPTPEAATESLCRAYQYVLRPQTVWEPCAGNGAMGDVLKVYTKAVYMSDIAPQRQDICKMDIFFTGALTPASAVITNPPFNIAEDIIWHVLTKLDRKPVFFALVLKATFWHAQRRQKLFREQRPYAVHPLTWRPDFHGLGGPTMDIIWTVWRPGETKDGSRITTYEPLEKPK